MCTTPPKEHSDFIGVSPSSTRATITRKHRSLLKYIVQANGARVLNIRYVVSVATNPQEDYSRQKLFSFFPVLNHTFQCLKLAWRRLVCNTQQTLHTYMKNRYLAYRTVLFPMQLAKQHSKQCIFSMLPNLMLTIHVLFYRAALGSRNTTDLAISETTAIKQFSKFDGVC